MWYLVERCQVELFGDELLEVQHRGLSRAADPLAFEPSEFAAVTLQADADLQVERGDVSQADGTSQQAARGRICRVVKVRASAASD